MYAERSDLLVGDMPLSDSIAQGFLQAATDEIDSVLGINWVVPVELTAADPTVGLMLKRIAALIASGRVIMAQATAAEDDQNHAYGSYLLREGKDLLKRISEGEIPLYGVEKRTEFVGEGNAALIAQEDSISAVDAFYAFSSRGQVVSFQPGDNNAERYL